MLKNLLGYADKGELPRGAVFLSGSGSNAEKVLEYRKKTDMPWRPAAIITDAPEKSRAAEIAAKYELPLVELSIREFYRQHGERKVSLATENGRRVRELWTAALRQKIAPYEIDFGILAGFVPLSNITGDFPCLNVHPGDLTVERNGRRLLVGLHAVPTELAIINGFKTIRSSVIIAQPYTGQGGEMDSGPVLGVSPQMVLDLQGKTCEELLAQYNQRPARKPAGGWNDDLGRIAAANQERLKEAGDWIVFPQVVNDFAAGRFAVDGGELYYKKESGWEKVKTVEYE
ncbi:MAG: hypothetical protein WCS27_16395 [Victivallaceae bacterium]